MADAHRKSCASRARVPERKLAAHTPVVLLTGDDPDGQSDVAAHVAAQLGLQLQRVHAEDLPAKRRRARCLCRSCGNAKRRCLAAPCSCNAATQSRRSSVAASGRAHRQHGFHRRARDAVSQAANVAVLRKQARGGRTKTTVGTGPRRRRGALERLAGRNRVAVSLERADDSLHRRRASRGGGGSDQPDAVLWRACRNAGRSRLDDLAQRLEPAAGVARSCLARAAENHAAPDRRAREASLEGLPGLGICRQRRTRPWHQRALRRRERHRQDHGGGSAGQRAASRSLSHRSVFGRQQVHRRNREKSAPRVRRSGRQRRNPALRRSRRVVRQTQRSARTATTATPISK